MFIPDCSITQHSVPEYIYSESLFKDDDVIFLRCNGILDHACLSFDARNVKIDNDNSKKEICLSCIKKRNIFQKNSNYKNYNLENYVTKSDVKKIMNIIDSYDHKNLLNIKYKGVAVGLYCAYELIINNKRNNVQFNKNDYEYKYFKYKILNSCIILSALESLLTKYSFKAFYSYNPLYSHNRCAAVYLRKWDYLHLVIMRE